MSLKNFIPISLWDQRDQPREKLDRFGPKALSNAELMPFYCRMAIEEFQL